MEHGKALAWLADWAQLQKEWQAAAGDAQRELVKIAESVQKTTYLEGDDWGALGDNTILHEHAASRLWDLVHRCRKRILGHIDTLSDIYARMSVLSQSVYDHPQYRNFNQSTRQRHENLAGEMASMYQRELVAKSLIANDLGNTQDYETLTVYLASWQMQPYVNQARIEEIVSAITSDCEWKR
ncbi:TPA: hypothetical protein N0F65_012644 [Lagenidium giganteum]|uniref:Uncharacterized protein n=1 Tax=Lagenidium giganteum TaxID=4803 RepID=A0AAV2YIW0_9STRA|nr:TPA: hypothetical protein N0F65_012644 [Lagenidium giganteum]